MLSIGGWNNSAGSHWSKLVTNATARTGFVTAAVAFLQKYNFDGLDLDYEYPGCPQVDDTLFGPIISKLSVVYNNMIVLYILRILPEE